MENSFKLNAAKKFFDILSGFEFVGFFGYGNEVCYPGFNSVPTQIFIPRRNYFLVN